jgi:hypothetical protein
VDTLDFLVPSYAAPLKVCMLEFRDWQSTRTPLEPLSVHAGECSHSFIMQIVTIIYIFNLAYFITMNESGLKSIRYNI